MTTEQFTSLIDPLSQRAQASPDDLLLIFVQEDGVRRRVTAGELYRACLAYARGFAGLHAGPDDLVVFVVDHTLELILAFWGALRAGILPAIFPPLTPKLDPAGYQDRVRGLVRHSQAWGVVTTPELKPALEALLANTGCRVLTLDALQRGSGEEDLPRQETLSGERTAFIQYSSGTTGLQKGVALSHRAILNNLAAIRLAAQITSQDRIVTWLPLHHDMGMLTGILGPVYLGIPSVVISPFQWVRDPGILLSAVHEFRGTVTFMPNFAFHHTVRGTRQRDLQGLDLSSWRRLYNASEPVRLHSLQMFQEHFVPYGLRPEALGCGYGLAEITGAVTLSPVGRPPRVDWVRRREFQEQRVAIPAEPESQAALSIVSSGALVPGAEVQIIDENEQPLPDRQIGQILVRSNASLSGYYRREDLTANALRLGWHPTGDLGYWAEGELFVTGRIKDLIINGGKNIYPEDVEAVADTIAGLRPGRSVAFGVDDPEAGTEAIVVVAEPAEPLGPEQERQIIQSLRARVARTLEVVLSDVRLVERGWVVKTAAGKMARSANREKYLAMRNPPADPQ